MLVHKVVVVCFSFNGFRKYAWHAFVIVGSIIEQFLYEGWIQGRAELILNTGKFVVVKFKGGSLTLSSHRLIALYFLIELWSFRFKPIT